MNKHTAKKLAPGIYEYRGFEIYRGNAPQGYWGAWVSKGPLSRDQFTSHSLRFSKHKIDTFLDSQEPENRRTEMNKYYARVNRTEVVSSTYSVLVEAESEKEAIEKAAEGDWLESDQRGEEIESIDDVEVYDVKQEN